MRAAGERLIEAVGAREAVSRRCLPHWYRPGAAHFVTYRVAGSLPRTALADLRREANRELYFCGRDPGRRTRARKRAFARYDAALHRSGVGCRLGDPRLAGLIADSLRYGDGRWYALLAYCVMPNHVHAVFVPHGGREPGAVEPGIGEGLPTGPLTRIMHSLKSYTAHEANRLLDRTGPFWQRESYDHWVRDGAELARIVEYVVRNPTTAGLTRAPDEWPWTWCDSERLL